MILLADGSLISIDLGAKQIGAAELTVFLTAIGTAFMWVYRKIDAKFKAKDDIIKEKDKQISEQFNRLMVSFDTSSNATVEQSKAIQKVSDSIIGFPKCQFKS